MFPIASRQEARRLSESQERKEGPVPRHDEIKDSLADLIKKQLDIS
jgi:hypothetical protein